MSENKYILEQIDRARAHLFMIEEGDLIGITDLKETLKEIIQGAEKDNLTSLIKLSNAANSLVEYIVRNNTTDNSTNELLGVGLNLMKELLTSPKETDKKVDEFISNLPEQSAEDNSPNSNASEVQTQEELTIDFANDLSLLQDFVSEALEHIDAIEIDVLSIEQSKDGDNQESINNVFRHFHTIKGVSTFLSLTKINKFSHEIETLLDNARNGRILIDTELTDFILECVDVLKALITGLKEKLEGGEDSSANLKIEPYLERAEQLHKKLVSVEKDIINKDDVNETAEKQKKECQRKTEKIPISEGKANTEEIDMALNEHKVAASESNKSGSEETSVKVSTLKLDNLIDMVGELVIAQSLIKQNPNICTINDQKLNKDFSHLGRITNELQRTAMALRMVPIKQTFQKMLRLVRDLSKKVNKKIDLVISGGETEIDRNMVEAIYDPLVHMIRNAVDHAIEGHDERVKAGKPDIGRINLRAFQKGDNIVIEIQDDGRGLDSQAILKKAQDKGLINGKKNLSEQEIFKLIFAPGFSTAEKITDISGRGVGMDVVMKSIEKLRGRVEIESERGRGTKFTILLPLILAIIDGMVVKVGDERYIFQTTAVRESLRPDKKSHITVQGKGELIKVRDSLLPLIRLYKLFGVKSEYTDPTEAIVLVVESDGVRKCVLLDQLLGKQEVVIKSLGESMRNIKGISGGSILGDGRVGLIVDINGLFTLSEQCGTVCMN